MKNRIYYLVDKSDPTLPIIAETDTVKELAEICHVSEKSIRACLSLVKNGILKSSKYGYVELDEEDENIFSQND